MVAGCTFAVAPQFSASKFWRECYETNARYTAYIGEMMRYILQQPPGDYDKKVKRVKNYLVWKYSALTFVLKYLFYLVFQHNVEVAIGTGLRYDIWPEVAPRFGDMWMWELYGEFLSLWFWHKNDIKSLKFWQFLKPWVFYVSKLLKNYSASTEGNIQLANLMNDEGCIMRWTPLVRVRNKKLYAN